MMYNGECILKIKYVGSLRQSFLEVKRTFSSYVLNQQLPHLT